MRIGVDGRGLRGGRGIARATAGALRALAAAHPEDEIRVLVVGDDAPAAPCPGIRIVRDRRPQRPLFAAAALAGRPRLEDLLGGDVDVVWAPAPAPLAVGPGTPLVLTVHDLSFAQRPADFTAYERLWHHVARPARLAARADVVLCDSAATRTALHATWPGVDPARTRVLHPGVDRPDAPPPRWDALPERFVLFVGAREPRKGLDVLLDAFARARADGLDAELVVAGGGRVDADGRPGVHVLGRIDDERLAACLTQALALVMPSWLEGFGLPPLEALWHGTPAIVSDLPVFAETLGADGAVRFPPGDAGTLADALLRVAEDDALRQRLVAAGRAAAAPLTWEAAAAGLHAALTEAAGR